LNQDRGSLFCTDALAPRQPLQPFRYRDGHRGREIA
jgi:hypothetical protein